MLPLSTHLFSYWSIPINYFLRRVLIRRSFPEHCLLLWFFLYHFQFETHQRLNFLTRSQTIGGSTARHGGRPGRREGLPLGDPPPPGDNIYEWLHSAAHQPPPHTQRTRESDTLSDKYLGYMLDRSGGGYDSGGGGYEGSGGGGGGGKYCDSLSDAYVKFDIKEQEPHYHYPNLDSLSNV